MNGASTSEGRLWALAVAVRTVICSTDSLAPREGKDTLGTQLDKDEGLRIAGTETRQWANSKAQSRATWLH